MKTDTKGSTSGSIKCEFNENPEKMFEYSTRGLSSTMIRHVDKDFEKGTVILVGNKRKKGLAVRVDMVNVAIARAITGNKNSENPNEKLGHFQFLDRAKLEPYKSVYLAAHGVHRTHEIDGRPIDEVAKLLVKAGYDGTQPIYSFACDLDKPGADLRLNAMKMLGMKLPNTKHTMADELKEALVEELSKVNKRVGKSGIKLHSDADGKTIVLNRAGATEDSTAADLWVVNPMADTRKALLFQKALMYYGDYYKVVNIGDLDAGAEVNISSLGKDIEYKLNCMDQFKFGLVQGFAEENLDSKVFDWSPATKFNAIKMASLFLAGFTSLMAIATKNQGMFALSAVVFALILVFLLTDVFSRLYAKSVTGKTSELLLSQPFEELLVYAVAVVMAFCFTGTPYTQFAIYPALIYAVLRFLVFCQVMFG